MPPGKPSNQLIIADKAFPIDWPTYTFRDEGGYNAHSLTCDMRITSKCGPGGAPHSPAAGLSGKVNRFRKRHIGERSVAAAQAVIKQFVIHLDGCASAEMCFNVLHNERGLSCHFILDNDGTLYQTLDLIDCGYHAAGLNESSIGIEISNRGDAKKDPGYYDRATGNLKRDVVACSINNSKYIAYDYTKPQYEAMYALGKALARYLPGIKLHYPQNTSGAPEWGTLYPGDESGVQLRSSYSGYLGHYHITQRKWDPGPFDFKKFMSKLSGRRSFPVGLRGEPRVEVPEAPPLTSSDERDDYLRTFQAYYDNNELEGSGGFFPVGPLDHHQLYHGGIHLHVQRGANVVAPIAGKIIMARNGQTVLGVGSPNFVLIQHSEKVGAEQLNFYSLYLHLAEEKLDGKKDERLKWMMSDGWADAPRNKYFPLDPPEPVQAGDVIGHVGVAGPEGEAQVHWEIFTLEPTAVQKIDTRGFWKFYSGANDQRFCTNKEILGKIEKRKDGVITQEELFDHFRGDPAEREWTHYAVTNHYSEWSVEPDWKLSLADAPDKVRRPRRQREIDQMFEEQILPLLWWTEDSAQRLNLPREARVYSYHPVSFLRWLNDLVGQRQVETTRKATAEDYLTATGTAQLDIDDKEGTSFVNEADLAVIPPSQKLQLPDIIDGYGD